MVVILEFADDLLLPRQSAGERVEFDPALEGKAVADLPMVETGTGPAPRAAPDLHRGRLSPGARRNLTGQTIEMPLRLAPGAGRRLLSPAASRGGCRS